MKGNSTKVKKTILNPNQRTNLESKDKKEEIYGKELKEMTDKQLVWENIAPWFCVVENCNRNCSGPQVKYFKYDVTKLVCYFHQKLEKNYEFGHVYDK